MLKSEVQRRVKRVLAEILGRPIGEIGDEADFGRDLECNSIDHIAIMAALEDDFDVSIPDREATGLNTANATVDWLMKTLPVAAV